MSGGGVVLPFPITRRHGFARRQAEVAASYSPRSGEAYIKRQLIIRADALRRRGVSEALVVREVHALEAAIRAELWKLVLFGGAAR
jgi:uncharacterized protein DUF6074